MIKGNVYQTQVTSKDGIQQEGMISQTFQSIDRNVPSNSETHRARYN